MWCKSMMHEWLESAVEGGRGHTPMPGQGAWVLGGDGEPGEGSVPGSAGCGKDLPGALWALAGGRGQGWAEVSGMLGVEFRAALG